MGAGASCFCKVMDGLRADCLGRRPSSSAPQAVQNGPHGRADPVSVDPADRRGIGHGACHTVGDLRAARRLRARSTAGSSRRRTRGSRSGVTRSALILGAALLALTPGVWRGTRTAVSLTIIGLVALAALNAGHGHFGEATVEACLALMLTLGRGAFRLGCSNRPAPGDRPRRHRSRGAWRRVRSSARRTSGTPPATSSPRSCTIRSPTRSASPRPAPVGRVGRPHRRPHRRGGRDHRAGAALARPPRRRQQPPSRPRVPRRAGHRRRPRHRFAVPVPAAARQGAAPSPPAACSPTG